jgi:hypothetical protein
MPGTLALAPSAVPLVQRPDALRAPGRFAACVAASALLLAVSSAFGIGNHLYRAHRAPLWIPAVAPRPVLTTFFDISPTSVTITRQWLKFSLVMPRYQFLEDATVWRQMHFEDWDRLDPTLRREGLARLFARYGHLVADAALWPRMSALDWDEVPQPLRAMAIVGMIEYWVQFYAVGSSHGLDPLHVVRTAKAIAMSESWFDHRAVHVNTDGSTDLGLGGASLFARDALRRLHARGLADFALDDHEYYNPWPAARWLAFWLQLSLDEADGDLSLAIRAYNVGIGRAVRGRGDEYLSGVERRRRRYFEGPSDSPTWSALSQFRRDQQWLPRLVVRAPLRAHAPVVPCASAECALPAAPAEHRPSDVLESPCCAIGIDPRTSQITSGSSSADAAWRNHR